MKLKEFWVDPKDIHDGYHEGWFYENGDRRRSLHVREVVPIDWEKVWDGFDFGIMFPDQIRKLVQELVEAQLKGEE